MKKVIIIWTIALIVGIVTVCYINASLNSARTLVRLSEFTTYIQPAEPVDLGNSVCLQNCNPVQVQPAGGISLTQ